MDEDRVSAFRSRDRGFYNSQYSNDSIDKRDILHSAEINFQDFEDTERSPIAGGKALSVSRKPDSYWNKKRKSLYIIEMA